MWTYIYRTNLPPSCVQADETIKGYLASALETSDFFRVVIDGEDKVVGVCTKGDFCKALQTEAEFSTKMRDICNKQPRLLVESQYSGAMAIRQEAMNIHRQDHTITKIPLVNDEGALQGIVIVG